MAMIIVGLFVGLIGVALLAAAGWTFYNQRNKAMAGVTTTGKVIDLTREIMNPGSSGVYCPVVEFSLPSGETITFTSNYGTRPASHKVGQSVNVRYDQDDPQKAEIDSALSKWLVPGILAFMGVLACCLGAFMVPFFWMINSF